MIENVKELLDRPEEWWLDTKNGPTLYYYPNSSDVSAPGPAPGSSSFVASRLATRKFTRNLQLLVTSSLLLVDRT